MIKKLKLLSGGAIFSAILCTCVYGLAFEDAEEDLISGYLYEYGMKLYKEGHISDAIYELKKALILNPQNYKVKSAIRSIFINTKCSFPVAELTVVPSGSICPGQEASFYIDVSRDYALGATSYRWDFGDGTVVGGPAVVSHAYSKGGCYLVKVGLAEEYRRNCIKSLKAVKLRVNTPPVIDLGPNLACCVNSEAIFDGSGSFDHDGDRFTYKWDFGDGETAIGAVVRHAYAKRGSYNVTLKVDDGVGSACSSVSGSFVATVNENPVAVIEIYGD